MNLHQWIFYLTNSHIPIAAAWDTFRLSFVQTSGMRVISSAHSSVFLSTQSTSFHMTNATACHLCFDWVMLTLFASTSMQISLYHEFLICWYHCSKSINSTILMRFSAQRLVFCTFGWVRGLGVYHKITASYPSTSAVLMMFHTLYALRTFSRTMIFFIFSISAYPKCEDSSAAILSSKRGCDLIKFHRPLLSKNLRVLSSSRCNW